MDPTIAGEVYLTLIDAASRAGLTPDRLKTLIRRGEVPYRGAFRDAFISLIDVRQLALRLADLDTHPVDASIRGAASDHSPNAALGESGRAFRDNLVAEGSVLDVVREMPS